MKRILLAAALIAASPAPALAEQFWVLTRSNPSTGVLDSCKIGSPAEGFAYESSRGYFPHYEDSGDEVDVVYDQSPNGYEKLLYFFRTREACLAKAQIEVTNAEKYK